MILLSLAIDDDGSALSNTSPDPNNLPIFFAK
jgi:hypothetical protein